MIGRIEAAGPDWIAELPWTRRRRRRLCAPWLGAGPRDLTDRIELSAAALRLIDQERRLRALTERSPE